MLKILAVAGLYPNPVRERHGIFTEHRLRWLASAPQVQELRVISPVPSFPSRRLSIGPYSDLSPVPLKSLRHGIEVRYPRYVNIPALGMHIQPDNMARVLIAEMEALQREGFDFDVVDAFYFYPDAVAAAIAARHFGKPLVATAFGNDLSLIAATSPRAARRIKWAADSAAACTAVCQALADELAALGVDRAKIFSILHGVDLELFRPAENRAALRKSIGLDGPTLMTAGHLIERKGVRYAIEALAHLPDFTLIVAGDGPEEANLRTLARTCGVSDRTIFAGALRQSELRDYYAASDAFVLMSSREGIANVIMESLACGTPVIATGVWGAPEIIRHPDHGRLVPDRTVDALVREIRDLFSHMPDRVNVRRYAETYSWKSTTEAHLRAYASFIDM